jgi:hypothetical protein
MGTYNLGLEHPVDPDVAELLRSHPRGVPKGNSRQAAVRYS